MTKSFALLALVVGGCGGPCDPAVLDAGGGGHTEEELAACEADLVADWDDAPPAQGLGAANARNAYEVEFRDLLQTYDVSGGAVAVSYQGRLVLAVGVGFGEEDALQPAHADELFRIASLSKQITAVAIMHLVEDGLLSLEDQVFDILSDYDPFPGATRNTQLDTITVRQLLTHRGGWNRATEAIGDPMFRSQLIAGVAGTQSPAEVDDIIRYMLGQPLSYAPGTVSCYSNFGYALLGRVIERKSGLSYEEYVLQNVLAPIGAGDMAIGRTREELRADHEVYYHNGGTTTSVFPDVTTPVTWPYGGWYLEAMDAHGGWIASPIDMIRFGVSIDFNASPPDQLTVASLNEIVANPGLPSCRDDGTTAPPDPAYWYGFGLSINSAGHLWHFGALDGTVTENVIASNGYSWAAFFNERPGDAFYGALDQSLWDALNASTFDSGDLFTQFPDWTPWMSTADFADELATRAAAGEWPTRLEGREGERRARFAPLTGATPRVVHGADCVDFAAAKAAAEAANERSVSLHNYVDDNGVRRWQAVWQAP